MKCLKKSALFALCLMIFACSSSKDADKRDYEELAAQTEQEVGVSFSALPPERQVDLYLYGVNRLRPSEHWLADYFECSDQRVMGEIVRRLHSSDSGIETFGLVLALSCMLRDGGGAI